VIQGRNSLFCGSLLQQWEGKLDPARHAVHSSIPQSLIQSVNLHSPHDALLKLTSDFDK